MKNKLLLASFCLIVITFYEGRSQITGKIVNDSLPVSGIHILNKNTKYGVVSNENGKFKIDVGLNDTLVFSGIQFYEKIIVI